MQRSFTDHTHEFVRASPLWWVQGAALGEGIRAAGIAVSAAAETARGGSGLAEGEAAALSPEEAASLVQHALKEAGTRACASGAPPPPLIADMHIDRPVPPVMIVHGTADTLVPHAGETGCADREGLREKERDLAAPPLRAHAQTRRASGLPCRVDGHAIAKRQ